MSLMPTLSPLRTTILVRDSWRIICYSILTLLLGKKTADPEELKKKQEAVSNQGKKKWAVDEREREREIAFIRYINKLVSCIIVCVYMLFVTY